MQVVRLLEQVIPVAFACRENVNFEPELLGVDSVSHVGSLHVLIYLADWHDEIKIKVVDHIVNHAEEHDKGSILEVT